MKSLHRVCLTHDVVVGGRRRRWFFFFCVQLALKHRRNKNGGQRIVVFVGSPIEVKDNVLKKLGISLRRSNVRHVVASRRRPATPLPTPPALEGCSADLVPARRRSDRRSPWM